ncbi:cysteine-rich CWC family protein [Shewanella donghaensis]|uniref:cysteine-rich CWC family protein n=1 Tax=Shewanella donghaensis TaxID=238836 RepID=UPI001183CE26|nr:cysteine-rich CWC family protein [Shewanella donghaensis]
MADVEIFSPDQVSNNETNSSQSTFNKLTIGDPAIRQSTAIKQPDEPLICPVCQQANQCAVSVGKSIQDCWCLAQSTKASIIPRVLDDLKGQACVCQSCYKKLSV